MLFLESDILRCFRIWASCLAPEIISCQWVLLRVEGKSLLLGLVISGRFRMWSSFLMWGAYYWWLPLRVKVNNFVLYQSFWGVSACGHHLLCKELFIVSCLYRSLKVVSGPCNQAHASAASGQIAATLGDQALATPESTCPDTEHAWMGVIVIFFQNF